MLLIIGLLLLSLGLMGVITFSLKLNESKEGQSEDSYWRTDYDED